MEIEATYIQQYDKLNRAMRYIPWLIIDGKQTQVMAKEGTTVTAGTPEDALKLANEAKEQLEDK